MEPIVRPVFLWILGHAQIAGNELIDLAVKQATSMYSSHNLSVPYDDVYL